MKTQSTGVATWRFFPCDLRLGHELPFSDGERRVAIRALKTIDTNGDRKISRAEIDVYERGDHFAAEAIASEFYAAQQRSAAGDAIRVASRPVRLAGRFTLAVVARLILSPLLLFVAIRNAVR